MNNPTDSVSCPACGTSHQHDAPDAACSVCGGALYPVDAERCLHCGEAEGVAHGNRFCDGCLDDADRDDQCATEVYGVADCGDGCDCWDVTTKPVVAAAISGK